MIAGRSPRPTRCPRSRVPFLRDHYRSPPGSAWRARVALRRRKRSSSISSAPCMTHTDRPSGELDGVELVQRARRKESGAVVLDGQSHAPPYSDQLAKRWPSGRHRQPEEEAPLTRRMLLLVLDASQVHEVVAGQSARTAGCRMADCFDGEPVRAGGSIRPSNGHGDVVARLASLDARNRSLRGQSCRRLASGPQPTQNRSFRARQHQFVLTLPTICRKRRGSKAQPYGAGAAIILAAGREPKSLV